MIRLAARHASLDAVQSKAGFLADVNLWPEHRRLDPDRWLSNFQKSEQPFAANMLNVFMYFNEDMVDALFLAAVQQLSRIVAGGGATLQEAQRLWRSFLESAIFTYVEGDPPNPTDSGLLFARKARQVLGIDQRQIVPPVVALDQASSNPERALILVDDFVGSGLQAIQTWQREYTLTNGTCSSFSAMKKRDAMIFYSPIIATTYGVREISARCKGLIIEPAHVLGPEYGLASSASVLWPASIKKRAQSFLREASRRAGIVDELGNNWNGFGGLALPLAFAHGVPDATHPLYYWDRPGWKPLIRRT